MITSKTGVIISTHLQILSTESPNQKSKTRIHILTRLEVSRLLNNMIPVCAKRVDLNEELLNTKETTSKCNKDVGELSILYNQDAKITWQSQTNLFSLTSAMR